MPTQNPNGYDVTTIDPNGPDTAKDEVWEDMVNKPEDVAESTADEEVAPKPKAKKGK